MLLVLELALRSHGRDPQVPIKNAEQHLALGKKYWCEYMQRVEENSSPI